MAEKIELTGRFTNSLGEEVVVTKNTSVAYQYGIALTDKDGKVIDVRFSKWHSGIDQHEAAIVRDWQLFGTARWERMHTFSMNRPSKFTIRKAFTPDEIALIEAALGYSVETSEIRNAR